MIPATRCATTPLLTLLTGLLAWAAADADPLHEVHGTAAWRHEFSGWLFPQAVAGLLRDGPPSQLDGGDDVTARYAANGLVLDMQVLTNAPAGTADPGVAFPLDSVPAIRGARRSEGTDGAPLTIHYTFTLPPWTVRIVATAPAGPTAAASLDAAVRALPWRSLGSPDRLH